MYLYAFIPVNTKQQKAFFVLARGYDEAKAYVAKEIAARRALPKTDPEHISDWDVNGWGTSRYRTESYSEGEVITLGL